MELDIFNFLVRKPYLWIMTHLEGHKVEDQATAQINSLEPQIVSFLTSTLQAKIGLALSSNGTLSEAAVNSVIAPELDAIANDAITATTTHLKLSPTIVKQLQAYALATIPGIVNTAYNALVSKTTV